MAENLYCKGLKANSKEYVENYDFIFRKDYTPPPADECDFDFSVIEKLGGDPYSMTADEMEWLEQQEEEDDGNIL